MMAVFSVLSLQECCSRCIVRHLHTVHDIDRLPLPAALQLQIKSYADSAQLTAAAANCTLPRARFGKHLRSKSDLGSFSPNSLGRSSLLAPFRKLADKHQRHAAVARGALSPPPRRLESQTQRQNCVVM